MKNTKIVRAINYVLRFFKESYRTLIWKQTVDYKKIKELKNKHKDKPCVIIGNGPSLNKMDLNEFKNYITIACNSFYLKHNDLDFVPNYFTVEDPLPAEDNQNEISSLANTTKIIPSDLKKFIKRDENTIYANFLRSYMRPNNTKFPLFSEKFDEKSYWGGTVLFFNLQLAHYLGCNPIYLVGVDLTYTIPDSIIKSGNVLTSTEDDPNHFNKDYFGKGKRWHLPEVDRMQQAFSKAYHALKASKVDLYNATVGGNLQEIPRKEIEGNLY